MARLEELNLTEKDLPPMKPFARIFLASSLVLAAGCDFGPISHESVANSLSRYVSESVARQIVNGDKNVSPETLAELSGRGGNRL